MKAKIRSECFVCYGTISKGNEIVRSRSGKFVHLACGVRARRNAMSTIAAGHGSQGSGRGGYTPSSTGTTTDGARPLS